MARLLVAALVAAAGLAAPANAATDCRLTRCCLPGEVCYEVQECYCPYDGCWCLPTGD